MKYFFILLFLAGAYAPAFSDEMILVTPRELESEDGIWFYNLYNEAFRRMGMDFVYRTYPSRRCIYLSDNGYVDGEMERVYYFNEVYHNLIRVEVPLREIRFSAFSKIDDEVYNSWVSLQDKDLRVVFRRGVLLLEQRIEANLKTQKAGIVDTFEQGIQMVSLGRADVYIDIQSVILPLLDNCPVFHSGVIESISTHTFLHKKNDHLVEILEQTLLEMKEEGLF